MEEKLSVGDVIFGTIDVALANRIPVAIFVVLFTVIGSGVELGAGQLERLFWTESETLAQVQDFVGLGVGLVGLIAVVVTLLAEYILWEAMLRRANFNTGLGRHRYLAFFGQAMLIGIGVAFGYLLLIIPGLVLSARWAMAPGLMIGEGQGVIDAMGNSWEATKGNTTPVALTILVVVATIGVVAAAAGGAGLFADESADPTPLASITTNAISNLGSALMIALGVYLLSRLFGATDQVSDVFD